MRPGWRLDRAVIVTREQNPESGIVIRHGRDTDRQRARDRD